MASIASTISWPASIARTPELGVCVGLGFASRRSKFEHFVPYIKPGALNSHHVTRSSVRIANSFQNQTKLDALVCFRSAGTTLVGRETRKKTCRGGVFAVHAVEEPAVTSSSQEYKSNLFDDTILHLFRKRMAEQIGWESKKAGYEGLIEEAKLLLNKYKTRQESEEVAMVILGNMFPPYVVPLFKKFIAPFQSGRPAAMLTAQVTKVSCQWLMGPSDVIEIDLADGTKLASGVKVEKCRFLEETKCAGSCIHTCKVPTQRFMEENMGVPLFMKPNYDDFSCEFYFGVKAPSREEDEILQAPCLAICPNAMFPPAPRSSKSCPSVAV